MTNDEAPGCFFKIRSVAVLGHSHVRQLQIFRNSMRSWLTEVAAPVTGALRLRAFAGFETRPGHFAERHGLRRIRTLSPICSGGHPACRIRRHLAARFTTRTHGGLTFTSDHPAGSRMIRQAGKPTATSSLPCRGWIHEILAWGEHPMALGIFDAGCRRVNAKKSLQVKTQGGGGRWRRRL